MVDSSDIRFAGPLKPKRALPRLSSFRTIGALILREMNTTYGRSPVGYLWAILQPAAGIGLMVLFFSAAFRSPPLGNNFPLFYATGMMPFMMWMDISGKLGQSLNYSLPFLVYPRISFVDTIIARFVLNILTQLLVSYIIIGGILLAFDTRTTLVIERVLLSYAMAAAFGFGVGVFNCFLMSLSTGWQQVWGIITRPLILVSGVIFMYDRIPDPYHSYLWFNPLVHITGEMRSAFYLNYQADYVDPLYVFSVSLVLMVAGLMLLRRYHRFIIYS